MCDKLDKCRICGKWPMPDYSPVTRDSALVQRQCPECGYSQSKQVRPLLGAEEFGQDGWYRRVQD